MLSLIDSADDAPAEQQGRRMRRVLWPLGFVVAGFLIVRALVELFVIDFSDPSSHATDWGGPSLLGVLLVHMGPGILAAVFLVLMVRQTRRPVRETTAPGD